MSQQSIIQPRSLTLTEELERLEQSITLTLQEIDHNFSRAHRIVTSSIIPIVEQYAKHSNAVWDGSKFWKQFFEASANVSLSSYEEVPEDDITTIGQSEDGQEHNQVTPSQLQEDETMTTMEGEQTSSRFDDDVEASSILDSPSVTVRYQRTPQQQSGKARASAQEDQSFADYTSPYENLKKEIDRGERVGKLTTKKDREPKTPGRGTDSNYDDTSPIPIPPSTTQQIRRPNPDLLLHRVLDKNYRVQATPHTNRKATKGLGNQTQAKGQRTGISALDSSPFSPSPQAPQLRSDIFGTPGQRALRTPGVSIQQSAREALSKRPNNLASTSRSVFPSPEKAKGGKAAAEMWSSDEDEDDLYPPGMSPPKTMQFHMPQSRLMQTPAREASKKIVEDLLMSAGVPDSVTSDMDGLDLEDRWERQQRFGGDDGSPSIVRGVHGDNEEDEF